MDTTEYIKSKLKDGYSITDLCEEFTKIINEINNNKFQEEVMDPLMALIDAYYLERHYKEYIKIFPNGISQSSIEDLLDTILEMSGMLNDLESTIKDKNLNPKEVAEELITRIFA